MSRRLLLTDWRLYGSLIIELRGNIPGNQHTMRFSDVSTTATYSRTCAGHTDGLVLHKYWMFRRD